MNGVGLESKPSPISGTGLFATQVFTSGQKLLPYLGKVIPSPPRSAPGQPTFILEIKPGAWIDGQNENNLARFANHSCAPNAELVFDEEQKEAWLIARQTIPVGEEITFDYGFSLTESLFHPCQCGQTNCIGKIVASPLRPALHRHLRFSRPRD